MKKSKPSGASVSSMYIVLAIVNLAMVTFVVLWSQQTSREYRVALEENRRTSERLSRLSELRGAAARVLTETVDVLANGNADLQRTRMHVAVAEFDGSLVRSREARALGDADYLFIRDAMGEMTEIAETILTLAPNDETAATSRLPRLHEAMKNVMTRAEAAAAHVRADHAAELVRESAAYDAITRNHALLSVLIAVFVIAVTFHGVRIVRDLGTAREREEYIAALQEKQKLLREREELLVSAEELATIGNYSWDIVHDTVYWSDELCRILGVPPGTSDANYDKYMSRVHCDDQEDVRRTVERAIANPGPFRFEHRWVRPNGEIRVIRVKGKIEVDAAGAPSRMLGLVQDITEKQVTEEMLRRQELQLREAQRLARVGSFDFTPATNVSNWSDELVRITGIDPESTPSFETYVSLIHPEDRQQFLDHKDDGDHGDQCSNEHRLVRPDGKIVHVVLEGERRFDSDGSMVSVIGSVRDITDRKLIEESLRISEERFVLAAKATNEVIWDWNPATNMLWCNDAFAERYGHAIPESRLYPADAWLDQIHPDDRDRVWQSFQDAIANGFRHWSAEYRVFNAAGEWRSLFDRSHLLRDNLGNVVRVIGASLDITERQRAAEEFASLHQKYKLVLDSTAEGIFGMDREGNINLANAAGARMFGYEVEEMIGHSSHALLHHTRPDGTPFAIEDCPIIQTLREGTRQRSTAWFWRKEGTSMPVEWSSTPMIDATGEIVGVVVTCTDITERLKIDRMKDEFVSTVSHELRTPLTSIRGALGLLSSGRIATFPEKAQRLLDIASTNTDRLVRLINDILDLERIDSGRITLSRRPVAVDEIIATAMDGVQPLLDRAKIMAVVQSVKDVVTVDPDRIIQTLTNLLSNAIKFSPADSTIRVTARRQGSEIAFSVTDEGRGIPSDKLESIFERFEQVDASDSRDNAGSGLGLAICRSIVRQHGGRIHAESTLGRGSKFVFTIPAPVMEPAVSLATRKVLICDSDSATRDAMRKVLDQSSFAVRETARPDEFMNALHEERPDVVLLDLCVPESNGFELLEHIRRDPATASLPVVLMSRLRPEQLASDGLCAWLPKPLSEELLLKTLKGACDPLPRPRVLIVEDDIDLARVVAALFESYDLEITHVATGRDAIAVARSIQPHLVILDLLLPDIDGFGVVKSLRTDDGCRSVPLLVYSALETSPEQQDHLRLGPTEFLTKSRVTPEELERRVASLLNTIIEREQGEMIDAA